MFYWFDVEAGLCIVLAKAKKRPKLSTLQDYASFWRRLIRDRNSQLFLKHVIFSIRSEYKFLFSGVLFGYIRKVSTCGEC